MHPDTAIRLTQIHIDDLHRSAPHHRFPAAPRASRRTRRFGRG